MTERILFKIHLISAVVQQDGIMAFFGKSASNDARKDKSDLRRGILGSRSRLPGLALNLGRYPQIHNQGIHPRGISEG
jgi:hypothetical protein